MKTNLEIRLDWGMFVTGHHKFGIMLYDINIVDYLPTIPQRGDAFDLGGLLRTIVTFNEQLDTNTYDEEVNRLKIINITKIL
jgi:hypothetical protein